MKKQMIDYMKKAYESYGLETPSNADIYIETFAGNGINPELFLERFLEITRNNSNNNKQFLKRFEKKVEFFSSEMVQKLKDNLSDTFDEKELFLLLGTFFRWQEEGIDLSKLVDRLNSGGLNEEEIKDCLEELLPEIRKALDSKTPVNNIYGSLGLIWYYNKLLEGKSTTYVTASEIIMLKMLVFPKMKKELLDGIKNVLDILGRNNNLVIKLARLLDSESTEPDSESYYALPSSLVEIAQHFLDDGSISEFLSNNDLEQVLTRAVMGQDLQIRTSQNHQMDMGYAQFITGNRPDEFNSDEPENFKFIMDDSQEITIKLNSDSDITEEIRGIKEANAFSLTKPIILGANIDPSLIATIVDNIRESMGYQADHPEQDYENSTLYNCTIDNTSNHDQFL